MTATAFSDRGYFRWNPLSDVGSKCSYIAPTGCFRKMAGKGKRRDIPLRRLRYAAHQTFGADSMSFESDSK